MPWLDDLQATIAAVDDEQDRIAEKRARFEKVATDLSPVITEFASAWSGSWIGRFAQMYTDDLKRPASPFDEEWGTIDQRGWKVWTWQDVMDHVSSQHPDALSELENLANGVLAPVEALTDRARVSVSPAREAGGYDSELAELDEAAKSSLGRGPNQVVATRRPTRTAPTTNYAEISRGVGTPHHIWLDANVTVCRERLEGSRGRLRGMLVPLRAIAARQQLREAQAASTTPHKRAHQNRAIRLVDDLSSRFGKLVEATQQSALVKLILLLGAVAGAGVAIIGFLSGVLS